MAVVDMIDQSRVELVIGRFKEALEAGTQSSFDDLAAPEAKAALDLIISRATTSVDIFCDAVSLEAFEPQIGSAGYVSSSAIRSLPRSRR